MKILHIEYAKTGTNLSGGEVCMLELIKNFSDMGHENILLTTDNGKSTYQRYLKNENKISYNTINSFKDEQKYGFFISYILRTIKAIRVIKKIHKDNIDLVICHSEFFPNSITYAFFMRNQHHLQNMAFYHMKSPSLFKGYEGEFTGKRQFPNPKIAHYLLNQWLYRLITPKSAILLTVNQYYSEYLEKKYPSNKVVVLENYGEGANVTPLAYNKRKYDLLWVGRFHAQKGLLDFIDVVRELSIMRSKLRVVIIGDGDNELKARLRQKIDDYNLNDIILLPGFLTGIEKEQYLKSSKIFAMTSTYESFGQVILEAMNYGLPVVAYSLPVYQVFRDGVTQVKILDPVEFARETDKLLNDHDYYLSKSKESLNQASKHSWRKTAEDILEHYDQGQ